MAVSRGPKPGEVSPPPSGKADDGAERGAAAAAAAAADAEKSILIGVGRDDANDKPPMALVTLAMTLDSTFSESDAFDEA